MPSALELVNCPSDLPRPQQKMGPLSMFPREETRGLFLLSFKLLGVNFHRPRAAGQQMVLGPWRRAHRCSGRLRCYVLGLQVVIRGLPRKVVRKLVAKQETGRLIWRIHRVGGFARLAMQLAVFSIRLAFMLVDSIGRSLPYSGMFACHLHSF